MAIEVFNRCEYKYILTAEQYAYMTQFLSEYMIPDLYNKDGRPYTISNIYYDTEHDDLIIKSLEKPLYKEKLRLRAYGVPKTGDTVFLEIKKKYKGIVNKRRTKLELSEAYDFLQAGEPGKIRSYMNKQVVKEIEYLLHINSVVPKVYIAYDRMAYFGIKDANLRISFDTNIRARRTNLRLEAGSYGELLLPQGSRIMEIKDLYSMPMWLARELSSMKIYKSSFSKYGTEYKNYIKEEESCLISC